MTYYKILFSVLIVTVLSLSVSAQADKYAKISINLSSPLDIQLMDDLELDVDHYHMHGNNIEVFVKHTDIEKLETSGLTFKILIPDFKVFYEQRQQQDQSKISRAQKGLRTASNFGYGSMGGFYTLAEIETELDKMKAMFPSLISQKFSIGTSVEGRPIWAVRLSDNPEIDEAEPTVYYDALHHAREPGSMATMINYMYWLLENYSSDPQVKYIVDERESYFVPVVNPDGYEFNRMTNPNGGGFWRKNRRINSDPECVGVDLNRNYNYLYGSDNCSSRFECSDSYRGPSAFSEPEVQAVRDFTNLISPSTAFTVHSYSGVYVFPDVDFITPFDYSLYSQWASDYSSDNNYLFGTGYNVLGGDACGTTDSYLNSQGVFTVTPEIGRTGFWPPQSQIFALVDQHVSDYFYQAWIAGAYVDVKASRLLGDAIVGGSFQVEVDLKNKGLNQRATNVTIDLIPSDPTILVSDPANLGDIPAQTTASNNGDPITVTIPSSFGADQFDLEIVSYQDGVENKREVITVYTGVKNSLFYETAEASTSNWTATVTTGGPWTTCSTDSYNGNYSICDSNDRSSWSNTDNVITLNQSIDLTNTSKPILSFFAKWSIEYFYDQALLEISTDGGTSWSILKEFIGNSAWIEESFDLLPYKTSMAVKFRFTLKTDQYIVGDGFYFDDFSIVDYSDPILDPCMDMIQNGDETGIDCGGSICPPCDCDGSILILNTINTDQTSKYSNFIISNAGGASIVNNAIVDLSAKQYIELNENFEVKIGSVVHFYIDNCQ